MEAGRCLLTVARTCQPTITWTTSGLRALTMEVYNERFHVSCERWAVSAQRCSILVQWPPAAWRIVHSVRLCIERNVSQTQAPPWHGLVWQGTLRAEASMCVRPHPTRAELLTNEATATLPSLNAASSSIPTGQVRFALISIFKFPQRQWHGAEAHPSPYFSKRNDLC